MEIGISTASLFLRKTTEEALYYLSQKNIPVVEVFFSTYREYNTTFAKELLEKKGSVKVHSIHTLTTQFEPQLYSVNERAKEDSFDILNGVLDAGKVIGASNYTFHGVARYTKTPMKVNYERIASITQRIVDECQKRDITLCYENVHWGIYNYIGFFKEMKSRVPLLKATLDLKQADQSGIPVKEYIEDMSGNIQTVHITDKDENGKLCLPGKGITDYVELFKTLKDNGFNQSAIIEVYNENYDSYEELIKSYEYLSEIKEKVY